MKKRIAICVFVCLAVMITSCDKLFIPGDVPDGPSALTLTSEAGERTAEPLSYFWEKTKTETTTEKEGPDPLTIEYDPLVVQPGETIRFTFADRNDPWKLNVYYCESDGQGGWLEKTLLPSPEGDEARDEEGAYLFSAPLEDGILIAEALWPVWVNSGIRAEVTYAFYVWSAKG